MKLPSVILLSVLPSSIVANVDYEFYSSITDSNAPYFGAVSSFMRLAKTTVQNFVTDTTFITDIDVGSTWKPIPSLDGEKLVFFLSPDDVDCSSPNYIAVVDTDGSNLKKLTERRISYNPNWMRDGSNRITYMSSDNPDFSDTSVWLTSVDSKPGEEKQLRTDFWDKPKDAGQIVLGEYAFDSFDDGSIMTLQVTYNTDLFSVVTQPCRLTFDNNYKARCSNFSLEGITWNNNIGFYFVSSSQRYITYLKEPEDVLMGKICYAEIDLAKNIIRNEICIFDAAEDREVGQQIIWYAKMTQDEKNIMFVYAHGTSSKVYNYNIADASIVPVSGSVDPYMHRYVSPLNYNVAFGGDTTTPPIFSGVDTPTDAPVATTDMPILGGVGTPTEMPILGGVGTPTDTPTTAMPSGNTPTGGEPTPAAVGAEYCTFAPDPTCYSNNGKPECCTDDRMDCPADAPPCDVTGTEALTQAPVVFAGSSKCSAYNVCKADGLDGNCCPNEDGKVLDCCNEITESPAVADPTDSPTSMPSENFSTIGPGAADVPTDAPVPAVTTNKQTPPAPEPNTNTDSSDSSSSSTVEIDMTGSGSGASAVVVAVSGGQRFVAVTVVLMTTVVAVL